MLVSFKLEKTLPFHIEEGRTTKGEHRKLPFKKDDIYFLYRV